VVSFSEKQAGRENKKIHEEEISKNKNKREYQKLDELD
jgi:hypothetical protein